MKKKLISFKLNNFSHHYISAKVWLGFILFLFPPNLSAQQLSEAIQVTDASFKQVLDTIEKQTEYSFVLDYAQIESYKSNSYTFNSKSIIEILNILTGNTSLEYKLIDKHIILYEKESDVSQKVMVSGNISAEDKMPVPGASIYVKGTTNGTISDLDGYYEIAVDLINEPVLVYSYVGYVTEERQVKDQSIINLELRPNIEVLDEVIIIGYGTANKEELTSSIIQVAGADLKAGASNNPIELIKGKEPGLSVVNQAGSDPT